MRFSFDVLWDIVEGLDAQIHQDVANEGFNF